MILFLIIFLSIIAFVVLLALVLGIIGYNMIYKRTKIPYCVLNVPDDKFRFPLEVKEHYREYQNIPCEKIYITNQRNIKLYGELRRCDFQDEKEIPTIILFSHGFQSSSDNDVPLFANFQLKKYDLLSIDHEGNGKSEGKHSGFGIYEYENIILWVKKINEIYNHKVNIYLHGVSMGGNSVLLTADKRMENVKGIISDCGFTTTYSIIKHITKLHFVAFSICLVNSLILKRNIFKYSSLKALSNSLYPILLIHGKDDNFVPYFMSEQNNIKCQSSHRFISFDKASHAMSYLTDREKYESIFDEFIEENNKDLN